MSDSRTRTVHHVGPCGVCGAGVNQTCVAPAGERPMASLEMHAGRALCLYTPEADPAFQHLAKGVAMVPDGERIPATAGINPANRGALAVLQFTQMELATDVPAAVAAAAAEISSYHSLDEGQRARVGDLQLALEHFLVALVACCPPGPARSTAISRAQEAKFWGAHAIALEGK